MESPTVSQKKRSLQGERIIGSKLDYLFWKYRKKCASVRWIIGNMRDVMQFKATTKGKTKNAYPAHNLQGVNDI